MLEDFSTNWPKKAQLNRVIQAIEKEEWLSLAVLLNTGAPLILASMAQYKLLFGPIPCSFQLEIIYY